MSKRKILTTAILIILIVCSNVMGVFATKTQTELQQENKLINDKKKQAEEELKGIKSDMSETMKQIQQLTTQITDYEIEISELEGEIKALENSIIETEARLDEAEKKFTKQEEMLQNRLVALYEAGETTYLDVLLSSDGITNFISNYYLVSEIATYDTELLDQMEKNKIEIGALRDQLLESKAQLDSAKESKEKTASALKSSQQTKEDHMELLTEEEKQVRAELEQYDRDQKAIQRELANLANAGGNNMVMSDMGFIKPVPSNYYIYAAYPFGAVTSSGSRHTGVDYNGSAISGKPIYAVADGVVYMSLAYHNGSNYYGYGECIIINHGRDANGNLITTLYAHGIPGTRKVSVGDYVTQGQVIMNVGTTGNSTGPHLHFEVRINGTPVNPAPYVPK